MYAYLRDSERINRLMGTLKPQSNEPLYGYWYTGQHWWVGCYIWYQDAPLFQHRFSMTFHIQKTKIHDLSAQHIFPSKRYTTSECIVELVTVPAARSTSVKTIKPLVYLHIFTNISQQSNMRMKSCHFYRIAQCSCKNPWHYHHFPWLLLFSMTFQAWKMVFLNSMTFHDQGGTLW